MIAKRILLSIAATLAVAVIAISAGIAGNVLPAWAQDILPPAAPAPPALGNPADLTAATAGRGEVNVSFSPAAGATVHWVWRVRYDNTDGAYVKGASGGVQTVTGLKPGEGYYFIVIAGRPRATGGGMQWSNWSNWSAAAAGTTAGRTSSIFPANPVNGDYDHDDDSRIEIRTIAQLQAMRYDLDGNGVADANSDDDGVNSASAAAYGVAFPGAATGMGCPDTGCGGYELTQDLDFLEIASAEAWTPVGDPSNHFMADFDGNGHVISNLSINALGTYVGLFGHTGASSNIRRVGLEDVNVIGHDNVGGLVGKNYGSIVACYVTGNVLATKINYSYGEAGGLVGVNGGSVTASYSTASATGERAGGLVGQNYGSITDSYATGVVVTRGHPDRSGGGLVGRDHGSINASYATGSVVGEPSGGLVGVSVAGSITNSYWDTETSGLSESAGGEGKTTAELQSPTNATGIYAAWNKQWWDFGKSTQYPVLDVDGLSVSAQRGGEAAGTETETDTGAGTPATDRAALVAFYQATGGANWKNKWLINNSNTSISDWHGVTVDGSSGRVTRLELAGVGLDNDSGGLSGHNQLAMLGELDALTHLDLSGNNLGGALPPELDQLTELTHLNLSGNMFRGDIGEQNEGHSRGIAWGNLQNLEELDLSNNKRCGGLLGCRHGLSGWIPVGIYNLPNLSVMNLSGNELHGGAKLLLDNGFAGNADATIEIDLSDNPWSYEPAEHRDYWNEFTAEMTRGFVDAGVLLHDKFSKYPKLNAKSLSNYAANQGLEQIQVRAVAHVAASGKYANAATWIIRGAKLVGGASSVVGWVSFTVEGAQIANKMLQAGITFLENGPGQVIKNAQNKYLGTRDSCLISNNLHLGDPYSKQAIDTCGDNR